MINTIYLTYGLTGSIFGGMRSDTERPIPSSDECSEPLQRGIAAYREGDYRLAAKLLTQALPGVRGVAVPGLWSLLGEASFRIRDYGNAIEACARAVADPEAGESDWLRLGLANVETGRCRKAIEVFEAGLQKHPGDPTLLNGLGMAWRRLGRCERAVSCYEQALHTASADPALWRNLGNACAELGDLDRAIDAYSHAVRLAPRRSDYWNDLGAAYAGRGDQASAVAAFLDAISLNPSDGRAWFNLAVTRVKQLDPPAARIAYQRLKIVDPPLGREFLDWVAKASQSHTEEVVRAFEEA